MELNETVLAQLKQKMAQALEQERRGLLRFASQDIAGVEDIYRALLADAEEAAGYYPDFDLKAEVENPEFMIFLHSGMGMKKAYEAAHHDELLEAALRFATAHTQAGRPVENGLSAQATAATPGSMANSTRAQRDAIRTRVSRGEIVKL